MGTVIQLKNQINNSYFDLKNSVEDKIILVEEKIASKLTSKVDLVKKMTEYHIKTGGKRLRALLTLESAKLCGYKKGGRVGFKDGTPKMISIPTEKQVSKRGFRVSSKKVPSGGK